MTVLPVARSHSSLPLVAFLITPLGKTKVKQKNKMIERVCYQKAKYLKEIRPDMRKRMPRTTIWHFQRSCQSWIAWHWKACPNKALLEQCSWPLKSKCRSYGCLSHIEYSVKYHKDENWHGKSNTYTVLCRFWTVVFIDYIPWNEYKSEQQSLFVWWSAFTQQKGDGKREHSTWVFHRFMSKYLKG